MACWQRNRRVDIRLFPWTVTGRDATREEKRWRGGGAGAYELRGEPLAGDHREGRATGALAGDGLAQPGCFRRPASGGLDDALLDQYEKVAEVAAERPDAGFSFMQVVRERGEGPLPVIRPMVWKGIGSKNWNVAWSGQGVAIAGDM